MTDNELTEATAGAHALFVGVAKMDAFPDARVDDFIDSLGEPEPEMIEGRMSAERTDIWIPDDPVNLETKSHVSMRADEPDDETENRHRDPKQHVSQCIVPEEIQRVVREPVAETKYRFRSVVVDTQSALRTFRRIRPVSVQHANGYRVANGESTTPASPFKVSLEIRRQTGNEQESRRVIGSVTIDESA